MYELYDGDYSDTNAHLIETILNEKLGDEYQDAYECAINNADSIQEDGCLALVIDYTDPSWNDSDGWEDEDSIVLTKQEIDIVLQAIPDPGMGPYFCWEPNFPRWLSKVQDALTEKQTSGEIANWTLHLSDLEDKAVRLLKKRFQHDIAPERMAITYGRYFRINRKRP